MPFIVTPGELNRRANFYHQLQQLTGAGLGIVRSLEQLKTNAPSADYRRSTQQLLNHIQSGQGLGESFRQVPDWIPDFDITLIEAGERSGRLDPCFRMLGDYYTDRAKIARKVIGALLYPAFLLHLLAAVMALVLYLWHSEFWFYSFVGLAIFYVFAFVLIYAMQNKHPEVWRSKVEAVLNIIPVVGSARRHLALARLAAALEALISAGVTIIEAWELAARASGSVALQRAVESWRPALQAGSTPAEILHESRLFPDMFTNQYAAGEVSGKLDETLERLRDYYQDDGGRKVQTLAQWVPILIYVIVLIAGGIFVVWFWTRYYGNLFQSLGI